MLFLLQALSLLTFVQAQDPFDTYDLVPSNLPSTSDATYSCKFTNRWSGARHPVMYPSDAHWSWPMLVSHNENYEMWSPGSFATLGVEKVAEVRYVLRSILKMSFLEIPDTIVAKRFRLYEQTGSTHDIINEIQGAGSATGDYVRGRVTFNSDTQEQTFDSIIMSSNVPLLSTITMIADSPDWFSGFYDFNTVAESGFWYRSFAIDTYPWDAGTEKGKKYKLNNQAEDPHLPIIQFTVDTVPSNGIFLSPDETTVLPVATWTCELENEPVSPVTPAPVSSPSQDPSCEDADSFQHKNKTRDCSWVAKKSKNRCRKFSEHCPVTCNTCGGR